MVLKALNSRSAMRAAPTRTCELGAPRASSFSIRGHERPDALLSRAGPAWWLNLQADPNGKVLADRKRHAVRARRARPAEEEMLWSEFARLNPGFDEYRNLTERQIPVVVLERQSGPG
jgi:deazaflavin-dependent oxidoreductase (nitroreductase family)